LAMASGEGGDPSEPIPEKMNKAPKPLKGLGNKNAEVEHFKTQFSVHRIRELVPTFVDAQKQWINEAGFGLLLAMTEFSVPVKLVRWMMKYGDPLLCEFRLRIKVIVFNRELVRKILGLENGDVPVKLSGDWDDVKNLREEYKEGERAKIKKCTCFVSNNRCTCSTFNFDPTSLTVPSKMHDPNFNRQILSSIHCLALPI